MRPQVSGPGVPFEILSPRTARAKAPNLSTGLLVHDLLIRLRLEVLADPEPAGIPTSLTCWKNVVRADTLGMVSFEVQQRMCGN